MLRRERQPCRHRNPGDNLFRAIAENTMRTIALLLIGLGVAFPAKAQLAASDKMNHMEHGPFVSTTVTADPLITSSIIAYKGIAVKVGTDASPATMVFDTDLLRVAGGWTGGFLHWYPARTSLQEFPTPEGYTHFATSQGPGWTRSGRFNDPRAWPYGPIPEESGRYNGMYLHGDNVVFSYTVADSDVLELPGFAKVQGHPIFTRTFNLSPTEATLALRVTQAPDGSATTLTEHQLGPSRGYVQIQVGDQTRLVGFNGLPAGAEWSLQNHHLVLQLPALQQPLRFEIAIGPVAAGADAGYMTSYLQQLPAVRDLEPFRQPGPARWEVVQTQAVTGTGDGPFVVDELTLPLQNPWNSYLRLSGVDFLSDGRAVVASLSGDVWLVSGIGETLGTLSWKRFATGLNQPGGLKVVDDQIYVTGRDQITRLHDLNGDGEADFYENFNNEVMAATNFHAFTMNLETDAEGNFYFAKATPWPPQARGVGGPRDAEITPHHGVLFRLSPDGEDLEIIATGLRNPNGLSISPDGEIVYPDNQGNWVPTSNVIRITEGGFHGFLPSAHGVEVPDEPIKPVVWIPHSVDNSPGSPIWITSDSWPEELQDDLMLTSYGRANLSLLLTEEVDEVMQGAVLNLPLEFKSGTMRGRFEDDGHLYIVGLTSWQSIGAEDGSFHRVRYTGRPLHMPVEMNVKANGLELRFSEALDRASATNPGNYTVEQWNYRWHASYGSPQYSVANPEVEGTDPVEIQSVRLAEDGRTLFIEIPGIQPVMGMSVSYTLKAADGTEIEHTIYNTINRVPSEQAGL
jgi:glucose/arabinose dehydrogenase